MNQLRRGLAVLLSVFMFFMVVPAGCISVSAENATEFAGGTGTEDNPYLIFNKIHLNNVRNHLDAHFKMVSDVEFTDADFAEGGTFYNSNSGWEPIGTSADNSFKGVFDGAGFKITGLNIHIHTVIDTKIYIGLFGYVQGTVQNLTIADSTVFVMGTTLKESDNDIYIHIGSVAGFGNVFNCHNYGEVEVNCQSSKQDYVIYTGGIVGKGDAVNCSNAGSISADITKQGTSYININVGGITGSGSITQCRNSGLITAHSVRSYDTYLSAGGLAGSSPSVIAGYNIGEVTVSGSSSTLNSTRAGGICGVGASGTKINKCYNLGKILSPHTSGGIVGYIGGNGEIHNCFNIGYVEGSLSGGIAGDAFGSASITNCYNAGMIKEGYNTYGILGDSTQPSFLNSCYSMEGVAKIDKDTQSCTAQEMTHKETFIGFDFESTWSIGESTDYPWPELQDIPMVSQVTDINCCDIVLDKTQVQYHTSQPKVTVIYKGRTLKLNKDYLVKYTVGNETWMADNSARNVGSIGSARVLIIGIGEFFNTQSIEFEVVKFDLANAYLRTPVDHEGSSSTFIPEDFIYDGTEKKQSGFTVCDPNDIIASEYYDITYKNNINVGTATLVITGKGEYYTGTLEKTFTIYPRTPISITITTKPNKLIYIEATEELDVSGGKITVTYDNGSHEVISLTKGMVTGFDKSKVGTQVLTVTYSGLTTTFTITVKKNEPPIIRGDVNGDGVVSITDMIAIKAHLLNKSILTGTALKAADTNGDGNVTITDFIQVKAHLLGKSKL